MEKTLAAEQCPSAKIVGSACAFTVALLLVLSGILAVTSSHAATYAQPSLTVWQRSHEGHLTIEWAETTRVQQKREGDRLILRFTSPLGAEMASALRKLSNFVDLDRTIVDSKEVSLVLAPGASSKVDIRDKRIVTIDFFRDRKVPPRSRIIASTIDKGIRLALNWPGPTRVEQDQRQNELRLKVYPAWELEPDELAGLQQRLQPWFSGLRSAKDPGGGTTLTLILEPQIASSVRPDGTTRTIIDLVRDAGAFPAPAAGPRGEVFIPKKKPGTVTIAAAETDAAGPPIPKPRPTGAKKAKTAADIDERRATVFAAENPLPEALVFNWEEPVAAAFFLRAGHLYAVFDEPDASRLAGLPEPPAAFGPGSFIQADDGTALRFPLSKPVGIGVTRTAEGQWIIEALPSPSPPRPVAIERVDGSAALRLVFAPGARVVSLVDPVVGDRIEILPARDLGIGQPADRRFVDLELLSTVQGMAWRSLNDRLVAERDDNGLVISSPDGLSLSTLTPEQPTSPEPEVLEAMAEKDPEEESPREPVIVRPAIVTTEDDAAQVRDTPKPSSYFDLAGAGVKRPLVGEYRRIRRQAITKAPPEERDRARLDLARLLVSERLATEARTVLNAISDEAEEDVVLQKRALGGVSAFLIGHLAEASSLLLDPGLNEDEEIDIWRAALDSAGNKWQAAADRWRDANGLLNVYPPRLKLDLGLMALEAAIETGDDKMIQSGIRRLTSLPLSPYDQARVDAMKALKAERAGDLEHARALLAGLTDSPNPAIRTLANFQLMAMGLDADPHQPDLLATLDRRIPTWRGHPQEQAMLDKLARRYRDANALRKALETWRRLIRLYPETANRDDVKMARQDTFMQALANTTKPVIDLLDVYAIYLDFTNLLPNDPEAREVHRNLARHLAALDLLDEAIDLFQSLMTSTDDALERAELAYEIATLMLWQDRPAAALSALNEAEGLSAALPPQLNEKRRLVGSEALARLGRAEDALRELRDLQSQSAQRLRARILWEERRWRRLAAVIELYFTDTDLTSPMTEDDQKLVLWLALARLNDGAAGQLSALRERFGAVLQGGPHADAFDVATQSANTANDIEGLIAETANQLAELERFRKASPAFP